MPAASNYLENALLNHVLRGANGGTAYAQPVAVYAALFEGNPETSGVELSGGDYVRTFVAFAVPTGGVAYNSAILNFVNLNESDVSHVALYDAVLGGNLLFSSPIPGGSIPVITGDAVTFAAGSFVVALGSGTALPDITYFASSPDGTVWALGVSNDGEIITTEVAAVTAAANLILVSADGTGYLIAVDNEGSIITTTPVDERAGDTKFFTGQGPVMTAPDLTVYRLTVENDGVINTTEVV